MNAKKILLGRIIWMDKTRTKCKISFFNGSMEPNIPLARVEIVDAAHKDAILKSTDIAKNNSTAQGRRKDKKFKSKSGANKSPSRQERKPPPRLNDPQDHAPPSDMFFQPVLQGRRPKSARYMTITLSRAGPLPLPLASPVKDVQRVGLRSSKATNAAR